MSLRIYLSSFDLKTLLKYKELFPDSEINALLSYGTVHSDYYGMIVTHRNKFNSLILDSGAFSKNFSQDSNKEVSLEGFVEYCNVFKDKFDFIFNYDEDFSVNGYEVNIEHLERLESEGIDVVPVVHNYNVFEVDEYINMGKYDIIALGFNENKTIELIVNASKKIKLAGKKVHLLGVSNYKRLIAFPFDYCDSSAWTTNQKYGYVYYWNDIKDGGDKTDIISFNDYTGDIFAEEEDNCLHKYTYEKEFLEFIKNDLKLTKTDLFGNFRYLNRGIVNVHYFLKLQDVVRRYYKDNFFIDDAAEDLV